MEQHLFETYNDYLRAQRRLVRRKLAKKKIHGGWSSNRMCFVSQEVVQAILNEYYPSDVDFAICHGVRLGYEVDMFSETFGCGKWIGTEIVPELCDGRKIINLDFSKVKNEWIGSVDLIYSNSLDHARNPWKTLKAWIACLSKKGKLYIEWTAWHAKLGSRGNYADCFAASHKEYKELLKSAGGNLCGEIIIPDITRNKKKLEYNRHIFVVK